MANIRIQKAIKQPSRGDIQPHGENAHSKMKMGEARQIMRAEQDEKKRALVAKMKARSKT